MKSTFTIKIREPFRENREITYPNEDFDELLYELLSREAIKVINSDEFVLFGYKDGKKQHLQLSDFLSDIATDTHELIISVEERRLLPLWVYNCKWSRIHNAYFVNLLVDERKEEMNQIYGELADYGYITCGIEESSYMALDVIDFIQSMIKHEIYQKIIIIYDGTKNFDITKCIKEIKDGVRLANCIRPFFSVEVIDITKKPKSRGGQLVRMFVNYARSMNPTRS